MIVKNPWVGYLTRSYATAKASILSRLKTLAPEIKDYSESNILVILVGIFAGLTEMLNYYIDSMARETFLETAKKLESVLKIARLVNYRVKASISSSVDITFTCVDDQGDPVQVAEGELITIPKDTVITDPQGVQFLTTRVGYIGEGLTSTLIPARQQSIIALHNLFVSTGAADQVYVLPYSYEDRTLYIEVNDTPWTMVENFGFSRVTDTHFIVGINNDNLPYVQFGDGLNGAIPAGGATIKASYRITQGVRGNVAAQTLTTLGSNITIPSQDPAISEITVNNINASSGGLDIEDIERIRKSVPLSLRTLDRAVTLQDHIDIAKLAPSVDKAMVKFSCGKVVTTYVSPVGGGIASSAILSDTLDYIEERSIIGLNHETKAAGETFIGLEIDATAKFRINTNLAKADIERTLIDAYSADKSDINKVVRTSDIIALVDNLDKVDFLDLVNIFAVPYARPINNSLELSWERTPLSGLTPALGVINWKLIWDGTNFRLYRGDKQIQTLTLNTLHTYSNLLSLKILEVPVGIANGYRWDFKTYPMGVDIALIDYTMPRIHPQLQYVTITVNEQSFNNAIS